MVTPTALKNSISYACPQSPLRSNAMSETHILSVRIQGISPVTRGSNLEKRGNFYLRIDFGSQGVPEWESDGCHFGIIERFFQEALNLSLYLQKLKKYSFQTFHKYSTSLPDINMKLSTLIVFTTKILSGEFEQYILRNADSGHFSVLI